MENQTTTNQGLNAISDVISNFLGILIVVLFISSISMGFTIRRSLEFPETSNPANFEFRKSRREWFPPFSRFYIIAHGKMLSWNLDETIQALENARSGDTESYQKVRTKSGTIIFAGFGGKGDIDSYYLQYDINWKYFKDQQKNSITEKGIDSFFSEFGALSKRNIVPCFFVYPSGMGTFSPIHERLIESGQRFRIATIHSGNPIVIYRHMAQFTADSFYYQ